MKRATSLLAIAALALAGCGEDDHPPLALAQDVNLDVHLPQGGIRR